VPETILRSVIDHAITSGEQIVVQNRVKYSILAKILFEFFISGSGDEAIELNPLLVTITHYVGVFVVGDVTPTVGIVLAKIIVFQDIDIVRLA